MDLVYVWVYSYKAAVMAVDSSLNIKTVLGTLSD